MKTKMLSPSIMDFALKNFAATKPNTLINALAVVAGSFLIVLSAQIYIPLPFTPVPITAQTLSVLLVGSLLGSKRAPLSVLLYVLYGALGFPVFSENSGGMQVLMGATGGYIFGFILAGYVVGKFTEMAWDKSLGKSLIAMTVAQLLIFVPGLLWLGQFVGYANVLEQGFYPFIIGGIIKTLLAGSSSVLAWTLIKKLSPKV
ncbi:MAG: biotin transporter BioY [Bdellovibrionota bacterium]